MIFFCGKTPKSLGILHDGEWNYSLMREHFEECEICKEGLFRIRGMIGSKMSEKKLASCRKNAKKGGWPKGVPRKKRPIV